MQYIFYIQIILDYSFEYFLPHIGIFEDFYSHCEDFYSIIIIDYETIDWVVNK